MFVSGKLNSWPIRKKLLLFLFVILIPASGILIFNGLDRRNHELREAEANALLMVQNLAAQQEQIATGTKQLLATLALLPGVQNVDPEACDKIFRNIHRQYPYYSAIAAATPDGNMFAASSPFEPNSVNFSDRKHFKDAIQTLEFSAGELITGRVAKVQSINFTYPVLNDDRDLVAIITAGFKLDEYSRFMGKVNLPAGCVLTILDHRGVRLFRSPANDASLVGKAVSENVLTLIGGENEQGIFKGTGEDGVEKIYAFKQLRLAEKSPPYLFMIVGMPKDTFLGIANRETLKNLTSLGIAALVAILLIGLLGTVCFIRPINHLVRATQRFGTGDLSARTGLAHTPDELGRLAKAFDDMASLLELRAKERAELNQRFRSLVETTSDWVWEMDVDGVFTYSSPRIREILGHEPGEIIGKKPFEFMCADEVDGKIALYERIIKSGKPFKGIENLYQHKFGPTVVIETSGMPVFDENGVLLGYRGIDRDITKRRLAQQELQRAHDELELKVEERTAELKSANEVLNREVVERKRVEEALRKSERRFRSMFEHHHAIMLLIDPESGALIDVNNAAASFYGYSRDELRSMSITRINQLPPEQIEAARQNITKELQNSFTFPHRLRSGEIRTVEVHSSPIEVKGQPVLFSIVHDISERKIAQEALARAEEKYRGIFENSVEGLFQSTLEGQFMSVNPAFAHILGYDSAEDLSRAVTDFYRQLYARPEQRTELLNMLEEQGRVQGFEAQFFRRDKSIALVTINVRAIRDGAGKILCLEGSMQDVTERKLAEKEKKSLESRLHQAQKLEAIGTLAGGIAHDFNNVLGIIMGYSELVFSNLEAESREKENIGHVLKACHRAKDLIRQILAFSRNDGGLERRPVDPSPIIKETLKFLRASIPATIEIRHEISNDSSLILANPTQIHQVLTNLCTNAAHAMEEKGGILEVGLQKVELGPKDIPFPSEIRPGPCLKLIVSDTGCGMDPATMERIFDPYFTTKEIGKGSGLGLAVVHGIVKSHRGAVTVYSEPGRGTSFHVFFPCLDCVPALQEQVENPIPTGTERILFVDDEKSLVDLWEKVLGRLGYKVTAISSSPRALELFRSRPDGFDLVITDYTMPQMTGVQLAEQLKLIRPGIKIIVCTGLKENLTSAGIKEAGIESVLLKPLDMRKTATEIRKALDRQ